MGESNRGKSLCLLTIILKSHLENSIYMHICLLVSLAHEPNNLIGRKFHLLISLQWYLACHSTNKSPVTLEKQALPRPEISTVW